MVLAIFVRCLFDRHRTDISTVVWDTCRGGVVSVAVDKRGTFAQLGGPSLTAPEISRRFILKLGAEAAEVSGRTLRFRLRLYFRWM